ncbi:hypothetical protein P691DRAFT_683375, partial [Macrolepiota fuliginosa MF-IS2]
MGSDGRKWAWKTPGKGLSDRLVEGIVKFGGGCVHHIEGIMNGEGYVHILDDKLHQSLKKHRKKKGDIIFQHDNDLKHKSKQAQ